MRANWLNLESKRGAAPRTPRWSTRGRRTLVGALASILALVGLVAFATPSFAQHNMVMGNPSCATPLGTGYVVTWVIANDVNLTETGSVTDVTGGLGTLSATTYTVAATPNDSVPVSQWSHVEITQTLPAGFTPSSLTLDISSQWSDGDKDTDTATTSIAGLNCAGTTVQTLAGHIYLCQNDNPTTTEELGGTIGATGPQTVPTQGNPLNPDDVDAGDYTMTATPPPGFKMVRCNDGVSTQIVNGSHAIETDPHPNGDGSSATEFDPVPAGGSEVGIFYVVGAAPVTTTTTTTTTVTPSPPVTPSSPTTPSPVASPVLTAAPATTTSPTSTPPATLAFTGAPVGKEWIFGLGALILGSGLILASRIRTRRPRLAASKRSSGTEKQ
jgi:cell division septation protein DedD